MGIFGGATVMLAPVIVYFVALRIDKGLFTASMGAVALSSMGPLFLGLAANQVFGLDELLISIAVLVPALIGMGIGTWLRGRISSWAFSAFCSSPCSGSGSTSSIEAWAKEDIRQFGCGVRPRLAKAGPGSPTKYR